MSSPPARGRPRSDESVRAAPAVTAATIEQKYGRPVGEWLDLGPGHGHANALVAHVRGESARS
jgi:hypothetical protein